MNKEQKRIIRVLLLFSALFISLIVYLTYFEIFEADTIRASTYNKRPDDKAYVIRGSIYDRNQKELAYSTKNEDKKQTRHYEYGSLYSHIIGYDNDRYGNTGLEKTFASTLTESNIIDDVKNVFFQILDKTGVNKDRLPIKKDSKGNSLVLTIDHELQNYTKNQLDGKKGAIVAMNPQTGDILSMVSFPDFDPNSIGNLLENKENQIDGQLTNKATQGLFPPGSIFKVITATSALENDVNTNFDCDGEITIGGKPIRDYNASAHGNVDLKESLTKSCNVAFAQIGVELGEKTLEKKSESFMINKKIPFDIDVKKSSFSKSNLDKAALAATSMGQGELSVTPLNMALMASAIANDGEMMKPRLVKEIIDSDNNIIKQIEPEILSTVTSPENANNISDMMVSVVGNGTGKKASIRGIQVAGKTGTAETGNDKDGNRKKDHSWFVSFAPADNPGIAVVVFLEHDGGTGGSTASPIARNVLLKYLK
ncbi:MAG: peptidoglycan D,D-transpeptidase FtsI family protein [Senegalia sp. (in: firmicutes)]|uniref:peptidoglycan D,D-transpeptidase FtsI family protein n=1 Tax=Senegalia sp. (in: firmicutes) TaxID=1924098 RepID=UPI003F99CF9D